MANDLIQNLLNADIDAIAFSEWWLADASTTIDRRLAPSVNSFQYFVDYMNNLTKGKDGVDAAITSMTVATGAAGTAASVVTGGTPTARTFALTIPRGDKGVDGSFSQKAYTTYAAMDADKVNIPANTSVTVTNDTDTTKNGMYAYSGTAFTKSAYDPLTQAKTYTDTNKADTLLRVQNVFATKALMTASALVDGSSAQVNNDTTVDNNGFYKKTAGTWVKAVYDPTLQANAYTDTKTEFKINGVVGKNLFDKTKIETGKALGDTGASFAATGRNVSSYVAILPSIAYSFSGTTKAAFYDANKAFVQISQGATANVMSASNAAFVRIDISDASLGTAQIEQNTSKTAYESYKIELGSNSVSTSALKNNSVSADKLQPFAVQAKHLDDAVFLNMHEPAKLRTGLSILFTDGKTEKADTAYDITEYISCKPLAQYAASTFTRVFYYDKDGNFLSIESTAATFTTPANCYQLRFQISNLVSTRFQLNVGSVVTATQQPYKFKLPQLTIEQQTKAQIDAITARKYSFSDAWVAWRDNQKFPICFLGDSTTNGNGTTGYVARTSPYAWGVDYVAPNSYAKLFQDLIREASGNTVMRAYNAGYSGQNSGFALDNIDNIMSGDYADTKMMGISHGINDRTSAPKLYADLFESRIEGLIQWCFGKGITPFLMTTQPMTIPSQVGTTNASGAEEIANSIKRKLASKYNLEIIDINKFGQQFMQYSSKPLLNDIMEAGNSVIHFGNGGHKFTAELIFANFCKRTLWTYNDGEQLDYTTQLLASDIDQTELNQLSTFKQGFKNEVLRTQDNATNKLYQDYYVFNAGRKQLNLTAYYANAAVGQYAVVDGVQTTITTQGQALGALDLGLHKIKAYSSTTTALDWLGFKLTPTA